MPPGRAHQPGKGFSRIPGQIDTTECLLGLLDGASQYRVHELGTVVAFLPLAVVGLTSQDAQTVRAAYLTMELIGW